MSAPLRSEPAVCVGGPAPECCQPIAPAFVSTRAYLASLPPGELPQWCPACGSRSAAPLYWVDADVYDCADCGAIWSARS